MNYSICILDAGGRIQRTQFAPYEDDGAAVAQARTELPSAAIVEVWKHETLLARLYRDPQPALVQ